jgi:arabinofuranosyltransferase
MKPLSSGSSQPGKKLLRSRTWLILALAVLVSLGSYLAFCAVSYRIGFPLDDSWIHQTFARNFALRGEWSFIPGQSSGGSTAPLWSALLSIGFLLNLSPYIWTFLLGGLLLYFLAIFAEFSLRSLMEDYRGSIPWMGLLVAFEWHLVWASASGMETILHALIAFILLILLIKGSSHWLLFGALAGIGVWVRPDGVTFLGPIIFTLLLSLPTWKRRLRALFSAIFGFAIFCLPYIVFNLALAHTAFPTTFYAKQAEYSNGQAGLILTRLGEGALQLMTGPGIILLPGVLITAWWAIRGKKWGFIAALLWVIGYFCIYLTRLPAYQHGRYLMPIMPIYFFMGLFGFYRLYLRPDALKRGRWFLKTAWGGALAIICAAFWFLGIQSYNQDVRFIESEMVDTAKWVATHIPGDALIATHDVGALGYFGDHNLVDMAGLISPEVIPFLRNEAALADYLDTKRVSYLVTFPDFYPLLTSGLQPVFSTGAPFSAAQGGTNMAVYRWARP